MDFGNSDNFPHVRGLNDQKETRTLSYRLLKEIPEW